MTRRAARRNQHLKKKNYTPIEDPATAFESGVKLGEIVNALYDIPMPKLNQNPRMRPQQARPPALPPARLLPACLACPTETALVGADTARAASTGGQHCVGVQDGGG